ncbi:MAG: hypothetical protein V3R94_04245 [Acidobacteriota bacterium]
MAIKVVRALSRILFWTYPRGGWQYDVVCGLILAFIFLTPKAVFEGAVFSEEEEVSVIDSTEQVAIQVDLSDQTSE